MPSRPAFAALAGAVVLLAVTLPMHAPAAQSEKDWDAEWVWGAGDEGRVNVRRYFRASFFLDSVPESARIRVTASGPYVLWVNGVLAGRGPERCFPAAQTYDTCETASLLAKGDNCIAVLAHHPGVPTSSSILTRPGLLAEVSWDTKGRRGTMGTCPSWKTRAADAWSGDAMRISPMRGFLEVFDSRLHPDGWTATAFDDSGWESVVSIGRPPAGPWTKLVPRESPFPLKGEAAWEKVIEKGRVREHGVLIEVPVTGAGSPVVSASFASGKARQWTMELRSIHSASCYVDGRMVRKGKSRSSRHFVWRLDVAPGQHEILVSLAGPPPGGKAAFHLSRGSPLEGAEWRVSGEPASASVVGSSDVARYMGVENDSFEDSPGSVLVSRSGRITMKAAGDGYVPAVILDFGGEVSGRPEIDLEAPAGTVVDLGYAEVLDEGLPNPYRGGVRHADRYICREGAQSWQVQGKRAFRYMRITMRGLASGAAVRKVCVREEHSPLAVRGSFDCSDPVLNRIWRTSLRTLDLCTEDTFIDCPWRERALWISDFRVEALSHYVVTGDSGLPRRCLSLFACAIDGDGLLNPVAPTDTPAQLEEAGLLWVLAMGDYHRMTGDIAVFERLEKDMRRVLGWYESRRDRRGLLIYAPRWIHIDWEDRVRGAEMGRYSGGPVTTLNALYAGALTSAAGLYAAAGRQRDAGVLSGQAAKTREAINALLWSEEKGVFADESIPGEGPGRRVSQQANILCLLYVRPVAERAKMMLKFILDERHEMALVGTPYFMHYFFSALAEAGMGKLALSILKRQWGRMLDEGATCFWESWRTYPGWSSCHGWSAHPLFFLANDVLGVKPAAPGYSRVVLEDFGEGVEWARGKAAVPGGEVEAGWRRGPGAVELEAAVPAGKDGAVRFFLRDSSKYALLVGGREVWKTGAPLPKEVRIAGGRLELSLAGGGRSHVRLEERGEEEK